MVRTWPSPPGSRLVPCRILQLGPGDYCRLAFQTIRGQKSYEVLYGGDAAPESPEWTNEDGLLLETRVYKDCNLNNLESVRDAFRAARPIGADYVEGVHHACNPFGRKARAVFQPLQRQPDDQHGGKYGFFTSSRDCSFLLIDDKVVVEAPGVHGPAHDTRSRHPQGDPAFRRPAQVRVLPCGDGQRGDDGGGLGAEPRAIRRRPSRRPFRRRAFRAGVASHLLPGPVTTRAVKLVPDFLVAVAGDVPLPDNDVLLIGVRFKDTRPRR